MPFFIRGNTMFEKLKAQNINLGSGVAANMKVVKFMSEKSHEFAKDPIVRQCAIMIINMAGTHSHNHLDECLAIGEWVQRNVKYVKDTYNNELLQDPRLMIAHIQKGICRGDCNNMAFLTSCLLLSIGIGPYYRCVRYNSNSGPFNHIYVVCYENNLKQQQMRVVLDCIIKDQPIGHEEPHQSGQEIKV
jgi:hypothetical protein